MEKPWALLLEVAMTVGMLARGQGEGVLDGGVVEGEGEGGAGQPGLELVEEVGAGGVAGLACGEVGVGVVWASKVVVKRSLGPKWRPAALMVVESPPLGWRPVPVATPSMVLMGEWLPKMAWAMSMGCSEP